METLHMSVLKLCENSQVLYLVQRKKHRRVKNDDFEQLEYHLLWRVQSVVSAQMEIWSEEYINF
jgi:hypothetical protein